MTLRPDLPCSKTVGFHQSYAESAECPRHGSPPHSHRDDMPCAAAFCQAYGWPSALEAGGKRDA